MHILDYVFFWPTLILKWIPAYRDTRMENQFTIAFVIAVVLYSIAIIAFAFQISVP